MNRNPQRRRWVPWQTSLRTLLLVTIGMGTFLGIFGDDIVRAIREYSTPPQYPPLQIPANTKSLEDESNGYFESAETPLRQRLWSLSFDQQHGPRAYARRLTCFSAERSFQMRR
jgi:hypothetical protein